MLNVLLTLLYQSLVYSPCTCLFVMALFILLSGSILFEGSYIVFVLLLLQVFKSCVCVLLCFINPGVRNIRHDASSCPGIFSRALRFHYVAPLVHPSPIFLTDTENL